MIKKVERVFEFAVGDVFLNRAFSDGVVTFSDGVVTDVDVEAKRVVIVFDQGNFVLSGRFCDVTQILINSEYTKVTRN